MAGADALKLTHTDAERVGGNYAGRSQPQCTKRASEFLRLHDACFSLLASSRHRARIAIVKICSNRSPCGSSLATVKMQSAVASPSATSAMLEVTCAPRLHS